ncbi:uncharacterized protein BP01DRAFT_381376 [Aspergillus saccharolyticus JOP 1030-1]|uniref:Uncharacterized protein n=1 Tax=Aspergillus saccharolyticus JOP 1030-1 TaxID=1450539 RepID=A0A318ZHI1_9EURO|nr:hypothetical protein BP01DRAFT_381376 [Aspergillus saccharolyticus JOP 1030-1]PYH46949.1 hypothetical protein BP01DRAFT_381376 [Aspergillus saccharolyticus JOP 1030-1]
MPGVKWDEVEFPDPAPQYELLDLETLPDPPIDFKIDGQVRGRIIKAGLARKHELISLVRFHGWGFEHGLDERHTNTSELRFVLYKIFYNQAPEHRPQKFLEVFDLTRDAGPRLLSASIARPILPVSRYYPALPTCCESTVLNFQRPPGASPFLSDLCLYLMSLPSRNGALLNISFHIEDHNQINVFHPSTAGLLQQAAHHPAQLAGSFETTVTTASPDGHLNSIPLTTSSSTLQPQLLDSDIAMEESLSRDRGPRWSGNSEMIDALIVVAKLLKLTAVKNEDMTSAELAFIEAVNTDWDTCSASSGLQVRDRVKAELQALDIDVNGTPKDVQEAWLALTKSFPQFQYLSARHYYWCGCNPDVCPDSSFVDAGLPFEERMPRPPFVNTDTNGITMQDLLSRWFERRVTEACVSKCGKPVTTTYAYHTLPLCLVVGPDPGSFIREHTRDLSINYIDFTGVERRAIYRWIGGIYFANNRLRVYWADAEPDESGNGRLHVYESQMTPLIMLEPVALPFDRIPAYWWTHKAVPLLFYECVWKPQPEALEQDPFDFDVAIAAMNAYPNHVPTQFQTMETTPYAFDAENAALNDPKRVLTQTDAWFQAQKHDASNVAATLSTAEGSLEELLNEASTIVDWSWFSAQPELQQASTDETTWEQ